MEYKVKGFELVEHPWEKTKYYEKTITVPDEKVRHNFVCTMCGMDSYPECLNYCGNAEVPPGVIIPGYND